MCWTTCLTYRTHTHTNTHTAWLNGANVLKCKHIWATTGRTAAVPPQKSIMGAVWSKTEIFRGRRVLLTGPILMRRRQLVNNRLILPGAWAPTAANRPKRARARSSWGRVRPAYCHLGWPCHSHTAALWNTSHSAPLMLSLPLLMGHDTSHCDTKHPPRTEE